MAEPSRANDDAGTPQSRDAVTVDELQREIARLRAQIASLEAQVPVRTAAAAVESGAKAVAPPPPVPRADHPPLVAPPLVPSHTPSHTPSLVPPLAPPRAHESTAGARKTSEAPPSKMEFERFIGRRVVPLVGALAVLGAVGYLVSHAIEMGYFGRLTAGWRFAAGIAIGVALLVAGEVVRRRNAASAAVGLDAAGIGAFMVSITVGVYVLELFGPETGALLAFAAGVFGAAWSVRTNSIVVGVAALFGCFVMPLSFAARTPPGLVGGLMLTAALAVGLGMHALGGARFAALRALTVALLCFTGGMWMARTHDVFLSSPMFLAWFALIVGEAALAAIRGRGANANVALLAVASVAACFVQASVWGQWGLTWTLADLRAWVPIFGGGLLFATSLVVRGFAPREREAEPIDARDLALVQGQAIEEACGKLSRAAFAFGIALALGGMVQFAQPWAQPLAWAMLAVGCAWLALREKSRACAVVSCVFALLTPPFAFASLVATVRAVTASRVTLPFGSGIELNLSIEWWGALAAALVLFASLWLRCSRTSDILRAVFAAITWIIVSAVLTEGELFGAVVALPACALIALPRARRTVAITALAVLIPAFIAWVVMLLDWRSGGLLSDKWNTLEIAAINLFVLATGALLASSHRSLAAARRALTTITIGVLGCLIGLFGVSVAGDRGFASGDIVLALVASLSIFALNVVVIGDLRRRIDLVEGGASAAVLAVVCGSVTGLALVFERRAEWETNQPLALVAVLVTVLAAGFAARALARAADALPWSSRVMHAVAYAGIAPMGAIVVSVFCGRPMGAVAASAWIVLVGIAEITIGFQRRIAALRWAGLASFVFVVARLYFVDLADSAALVRVALLFATGIALVGVGIVYARREPTLSRGDES